MIPDSAAAAISFLLFVTPGLIWEVLRERAYPPFGGSVFREASRTALASVAFSGLAVTALAGVRALWPDLMPNVGAWLRNGSYSDEHYLLIARTAAIEVVLACGLAALAVPVVARAGPVVRRLLRRPAPPNVSEPVAWSVLAGQASGARRDKPSRPQLLLRLRDGRMYLGAFLAMDYLEDANPPMVALKPPIARFRDGEREVLPAEWGRVAIPLEHVQEMWVRRVEQ